MTTIEGDILSTREGVILHQVNCLGRTGGLAGALRKRFPRQFMVYDAACAKNAGNIETLLGRARCGYDDRIAIVHVFGQVRFGTDRPHTDLEAVDRALAEAAKGVAHSHLAGMPIFVPYKMGCGLGGGPWEDYERLLERHFPAATIIRNPRYL